jgi:phage shock protein A
VGSPPALLTVLTALLTIVAGCAFLDETTAKTPVISQVRGVAAGMGIPLMAVEGEEAPLTPAQLQSVLMAFADEYMERLSETSDEIVRENPDPHVRLAVHRRKVHDSMAAQTISVDPNPEVALLDMVVLVTLGRMVVEHLMDPAVPGAETPELLATLAGLEEEIWDIAEAVLTEEQQNDLREAILEYRARRPEQRYVGFVRFADFAGSRHQTQLLQAVRTGLLPRVLPSVDEAARAVDETRLVAERALHLMEKMPIFLTWQAEMLLYQLAVTPEAQRLQSDLSGITESAGTFSESTNRFARAFETLARQVSGEQGHRLMDDARATMAEVQRSTAQMEALVSAVGEAAPALTEAAESIERMAQSFRSEEGERDPDAEPFDIEDYTRAMGELTGAVRELNTLLNSTEQFLESAAFTEGLGQINERAVSVVDHTAQRSERLMNQTFWRALILIAVFWLLALIALLAVRRFSPAD